MTYSKDLTIITIYEEYYENSTSTPDYVITHNYHVPFFAWVVIAAIILFIGIRILLEFIIRWRVK